MVAVDWVREYGAGRARIVALIDSIDARGAATVVPACPEWTLHDVVAHLTGLAVDLGAGRLPDGPTQPWIEGHVAARRDHPVGLLLDEWLASDVEGFLARAPTGQLVYDLCAHEHDLFHALGREGDRESSTVHASVEAMVQLLARDLQTKGAPGAVELRTGRRSYVVGDGEVRLVLDATPFELIRVFGSRRSVAQMRRLPWRDARGQPADIEPWLAAFAHFSYPADDLIE